MRGLLIVSLLALSACGQPYGIDCRVLIAGWHPDIPPAKAVQCERDL